MGYFIEKEFLVIFVIPLYLIVLGITILKKKKKGEKIDFFREIVKFGFVLYIIALIGVTLFPIRIGYGRQAITMINMRINYIPFKSIIYDIGQIGIGSFSVRFQIKLLIMNVLGNLILLMPIGFIVPVLWKKVNSLKDIVIVGFLVSLSIELLQLLENFLSIGFFRVVDVDDLILNVLGAVFGYMAYQVAKLVVTKYKIKRCI
ncbi:VanZ family protein [Clostridium algidicarnis]|uniref:VanZ family protein n=1 Tax=Clostridium algidicarnis TaxID=37659 RepID=UPI001C0E63E9|nr:VanZ family protein [Clostridium algidicarnis]MBU3212552.1 VanZ family protein [Clostridium algidicarnis]MBU3222983.1 VanZ family protein [Clostridium algidicarnis]